MQAGMDTAIAASLLPFVQPLVARQDMHPSRRKAWEVLTESMFYLDPPATLTEIGRAGGSIEEQGI
jgi:hypothetical protein